MKGKGGRSTCLARTGRERGGGEQDRLSDESTCAEEKKRERKKGEGDAVVPARGIQEGEGKGNWR